MSKKYVYLGKFVDDIKKTGFDAMSEGYGIINEISKLAAKGTGDARKRANAQFVTLWLIIQKSDKFTSVQKGRLKSAINKARVKRGWKKLKAFKTKSR